MTKTTTGFPVLVSICPVLSCPWVPIAFATMFRPNCVDSRKSGWSNHLSLSLSRPSRLIYCCSAATIHIFDPSSKKKTRRDKIASAWWWKVDMKQLFQWPLLTRKKETNNWVLVMYIYMLKLKEKDWNTLTQCGSLLVLLITANGGDERGKAVLFSRL